MRFRLRSLVLVIKVNIVVALAAWFGFLAWTRGAPIFVILAGVLLAPGALEVRRAMAAL
jgi:hypothetical protein